MTTYAQFMSALAALGVSGVETSRDYPPTSLSTADLPALWVQAPRGESGALTFQSNDGWPSLSATLVVAMEPVGQNTQPVNFQAVVSMMDSVASALGSADITRGALSWAIRQDVVLVGDVAYWAVVADVSGSG